MPAPASLKEIALALGLHVSTVSRALRNSRKLPEATRARVHAKAEELGYRPSPLLARLGRRRWRRGTTGGAVAVALVMTSRNAHEGLDQTVREVAAERGFAVTVMHYDGPEDGRRLTRVLRSRGICGVLLGPLHELSILEAMDWAELSVVSCGVGLAPGPFHFVDMDYFHAVEQGVRWVGARCEGRVGFVSYGGGAPAEDDARRGGAFAWATRTQEKAIPPLTFSEAARPERLSRWVTLHQVKGVFSVEPVVGIYLRAAGMGSLPFCCIDSVQGEVSDHGFPRVRLSRRNLANAALDLLRSQLDEGRFGVPEHQVAHLVRGVLDEGGART